MENFWNHLFCRTPISKEVAKHAAFMIIPQVVLGGAFAGVWKAHPSSFDGELEKNIFLFVLAFLIGGHIALLIYYYTKLLERYRARRQVFVIQYQPVRQMPEERSLPVGEDNYIDIRQIRQFF